MKKEKEKKTETAEETAAEKETETVAEEPETEKKDENVVRLEKALEEEKDKFLRLYADFENYKKRTAAEKDAAYLNASAQTLAELLPVVDNLERALAAAEEENPLKKGVEMVLSQVNASFVKLGVEVYGEKGDVFDPNIHEAVMHGEDENLAENTVSDVFSKGYKIKDKIIRHAMVKVVN